MRFEALIIITFSVIQNFVHSQTNTKEGRNQDDLVATPTTQNHGILEFPSKNILVVAMAGTPSHSQFYGGIAQILATRGHNVTLISQSQPSHSAIHYIGVDGDITKMVESSMDLADELQILQLMKKYPDSCIKSMKEPRLREFDIESFDVVISGIMISDCFLYLLDNSKVPIISFVPNTITAVVHSIMGTIEFPSVTPDIWVNTVHPMSFFDRINNVGSGYFAVFLYNYFLIPYADKRLCSEKLWCPGQGEATSLMDISRRSALLFINTVESLQKPTRPLPPNVVAVGGLNCRDAVELPTDLQKWADKATDGFVYFSLGSAVKTSDLDERTVSEMMEGFRQLNLKVIWKSDMPTPRNTPPNVRMEKWLPQQDLLGHPNCKLFISHGGLFSITEAIYHGVPMLFIPVFGDQHGNANKAKIDGMGEVMDLKNISSLGLMENINNLIAETKYRSVMEATSTLMRDRPISPKDLVVYWTEYVMRHRGAPHLRSPFHDLYWFQVYNLDVYVFLTTVVLLLLAFTYTVLSCIVRRCYRCVFSSKNGQPGKRQKRTKND